jgi:hypothetical protein|tara:strand:+ start:613 stop:1437 length:825 start_codon:yes stop_codon:yes gene_type:complete
LFCLGNDELSLTLLDPVEDETRLGTRYVSGCYIHQVEVARLGPLFSGPVYPEDPPPVFHGQGIPEAFRITVDPVDGQGICFGNSFFADDGSSRRHRKAIERCRWRIDQEEVRLRMSTTQRFGDLAINLHREIALAGREVTSATRVQNIGSVPVPLTWFAHPFFPWPEDGVCCRFSGDISLSDNPGFGLDENGFIVRLPDHDWSRGQLTQIEGLKGHRLDAVMRHPVRGEMTVQGDFAMSQMPIWGNACTVSFEPYLEESVDPNAELAWSLSYHL